MTYAVGRKHVPPLGTAAETSTLWGLDRAAARASSRSSRHSISATGRRLPSHGHLLVVGPRTVAQRKLIPPAGFEVTHSPVTVLYMPQSSIFALTRRIWPVRISRVGRVAYHDLPPP